MAAQKDDAAKDKFREALERKRGKQHPHEAASQNSSKVHDTHSAAGGKRTFRRKSG
jgi:Family of unknown function (DUF5302)